MDSRQFCSVCKQWLDMEVVPTADGDDDGVVWFRCPQCQGFLPKLSSAVAGQAVDPGGAEAESGADEAPQASAGAAPGADGARRRRASARPPGADDDDGDTGGSLADDALFLDDDGDQPVVIDEDVDVDGEARPGPEGPGASAEPVLEYAARLAAADPETAVPYRPWDSYEVGQCVLHLAWNDCGIVVGKEALPGGRRIIKCWFQGAGVVRLIENAPR
jgi:hypothetical protein